MSVLVLSEHDVRELLDMESCVAAMEDVLARLERGELTNPLRFVMRPPGSVLMGLMPAHATGEKPVFALKEIVISPANSERGLDPHQGAVLLHDGETGELTAILNASPITEIRTAAVSAVATKLLARPGSRTVAVLGSGRTGALPRRRDADGARRSDHPDLEPQHRARGGPRARDPLARRGDGRGGARRRRHRLHHHRRPRARSCACRGSHPAPT